MAGKGQKRRRVSVELSQDLVQESAGNSSNGSTTSGTNSNDSVERLANLMASFIQNTNSASVGSARADVVPEFDPENREQSSETWITKVDELRQIFNWSENTTIYFALSKLKGLAEVWYKGLQTMKYTWDEWKHNILMAFPSARDYYGILSEMMRRKKLPHETFQKYFYEKLSLLNQCKIKGTDAVSCILGGIDDTMVKAAARAGNYGTPEELFRYLCTLHDLRPLANKQVVKSAHRTDHRSQPYRKADNGNRGAVKCFGCGKLGHIQRDCKAPRIRCGYCRNNGHLESNCFLKKQSTNGSGDKRAVL